MDINERKKAIIGFVNEKGACSYQELEKLLGVSNITVRRDVDRLAGERLVIKSLGGVQKANAPPSFYESNIFSRLSTNKEEKVAIAEKAFELISPQQTIYLDGSSTSLELTRLLAKKQRDLTVVTNSALVCLELLRGTGNIIVMIGGHHDPVSFCFVGETAEEQAKKYFIEKAFISTKGFLPEEGTFESSIDTFRITQIIARQCKELILLADYSKFGQRALCKVLDTDQIHTVITDENISCQDLEVVKRKVQTAIVAMVAGKQRCDHADSAAKLVEV